MFAANNTTLMITCGMVKFVCFFLVSAGASIILTRVIKQKSFTFLKNQTILMLIYSFTVLMDGLYLCGIDNKLFDYYLSGEPWYKRLIGLLI